MDRAAHRDQLRLVIVEGCKHRDLMALCLQRRDQPGAEIGDLEAGVAGEEDALHEGS